MTDTGNGLTCEHAHANSVPQFLEYVSSADTADSNALYIHPYVEQYRHMDQQQIVLAFAALSQPTRLDVFRLLVRHEPDGLPAGEVARRLAVPHNTMSSHLGILSRAGLIAAERRSRSIIYRAQLDAVRAVASYLIMDCCGGRPELCAPLIADLSPCRPAQTTLAKEAVDG